MHEKSDDHADAASEAGETETKSASGNTRRTFLKRAGLGVALVGLGAATDAVIRDATTPLVPPRTAVTTATGVRIDNVIVVDPVVGSSRPGHSIVVQEGRITDVLPTASVPTESAMRVVDGAGRFAVPGYNDMHTHALQSPNPSLAFALMLAQGITGMRQMEGSPALLRNRAEHRLGLSEMTPQLLQMPGELLLPFNANTVDGVKEEIARQWDQGADFIKMVLTDSEVFGAAITAAHDKGLRIAGHIPPTVRIADAARRGFDSIEHLGTGSSIFLTLSTRADALWAQSPSVLPFPDWATRLPGAGWAFDTFLKKNFLGPATSTTDAAQLVVLKEALSTFSEARAGALGRSFVENQTWNTPTMANLRSKYRLDDPDFRNDPWLRALPAGEREAQLATIEAFSSTPATDLEIFHDYYDHALQVVGVWAKEGAPIMTGTDASGRAVGISLESEFRELGRAGLTPLQVLQAATSQPATYLGRTHHMGRIAAGMDADLLLLDSDPLASIDGLSSLSLVMRAGHDYTPAELQHRVASLTTA